MTRNTREQQAAALEKDWAENPRWKKVYADYAKFRNEQNLWFQFTEMGFDRFMQAQKF